VTTDGVLDELRHACGGRSHAAGEEHAVAGVQPSYVAEPGSTADVAATLRVAADRGLSVVARGNGTKQHWGVPPERLDLLVETRGLAGVREHAAGDLVSVAGAGTPFAAFQELLARADQQLALDEPVPGGTLGGLLATAASGPRRLLHGTLRDLLIGVTFVRADGVVAKSGGRVVKNVAGYDFGKLLTGSYGTLAIITELVVRLHPVPKLRRWVRARFDDGGSAARAGAAVVSSQLVASAVEVDQPVEGPAGVTVLVEGVEAGVAARAEHTRRLLGGAATVTQSAPEGFGDYSLADGGVVVKVTSTVSGVADVLAASRRLGLSVRGSLAGVLYVVGDADPDPARATAAVEQLRRVSAAAGGHAVVLGAPGPVRDRVDVWGPVPGLDLMWRLKEQLDPDRRLAPGRFVGGI
jgi:glycolate oxidase FAD binding subunit